MLRGRVLITGGSGFLGRALLQRAVAESWPAQFTVYSRDETKQWELKHRFPKITCVLGDVRDLERLMAVMPGHDTVIHAGAVKYIPEAEHNVFETIDVNIMGSRNVTIAARAAGVKTVVGISTDKACSPLNVYGMTKAIMERLFSEACRNSSTDFVTVRYGNVVGSTGSVIPLFARQIAEHGEIKVTDERMTRFWLGVGQALDLILFAVDAANACRGYTIIDPCPAMRIVDLAKAVWFAKVGDPGKTTREVPPPVITFTGMRPGEKLHEALFNEQEAPRITRNHRYFLMKPATDPPANIMESAYTSDAPKHWLSVSQMLDLMVGAESV